MCKLNLIYSIAVVKVPDIIGGIDRVSKSQAIWDKMKIFAIFVFLIGAVYYTLQSGWYKLRGIDEYEKHKSIYKATYDEPTPQSEGMGPSSGTVGESGNENEEQENDKYNEDSEEEGEPQQEPTKQPNGRRGGDRRGGRRD